MASAVLVSSVFVGLAPADRASAQAATVRCVIQENRLPASGTVALMSGDTQIASGTCSRGIEVEPGTYTAVIQLSGALDRPSKEKSVTVAAGETKLVRVDFRTGMLEVRIEAKTRGGTGMAIVFRDGKKIGTLGNAVAVHLSTGTYDVVVRYAGQEQRFEKTRLRAGQHRVLRARF